MIEKLNQNNSSSLQNAKKSIENVLVCCNFWKLSETTNDLIRSNNNGITLSEIKDEQLEYNIDLQSNSVDLF